MDPGIGQSVVTQLGIGGALAVVIAWVMVHVFKLFIANWDKQETARTEAYKISAAAHAQSLTQIAVQMERLTTTIGERVADALNDVKIAITRLEGRIDSALDWQDRTPVEMRIPQPPHDPVERARSEREERERRTATASGYIPRRAKSEPSDR
jgi:hypothetical protein